MKKYSALFLFIMFGMSAAQADYDSCIFKDFGKTRDMKVLQSKTVKTSKDLNSNQKKQLLAIGEEWGVGGIDEIIANTDDSEMELMLVQDTAHNKKYEYYKYYAGGNPVGDIFEYKSTKKIGANGDGDFYCDVPYTAYDKLPLFFAKPKVMAGLACFFGSNLIDLARREQFTFSKKYQALAGTAVDFADSQSKQVYTIVMSRDNQSGEIKTKASPGFVLATLKDGAVTECVETYADRGWTP